MKKFFLRVSHWDTALAEAKTALLAGAHRHDVLEAAIRAQELDVADDSVGLGGYPNILGRMELDAAFMDGNSRNAGAVCGLEHFLPVRVARKVMELCPHVLLSGEGAERFAREVGLNEEKTFSLAQKKTYAENIAPRVIAGDTPLLKLVCALAELPDGTAQRNFDTTIMVASDGTGMSAAASTSGWPYKYPGRVGDAPIIGAGMYVDSAFGAAACTYTGEMALRTGVARFVVAQLEAGKSTKDAVHGAAANICRLKGGVLRSLVIHAIDAKGEAHAVTMNCASPIYYHCWHEGMPHIEKRLAEAVQGAQLGG